MIEPAIAAWNEGLSIQGSVKTGHIEPVFVVDTGDPWVDSMLMDSNVLKVGILSVEGGKISVEATAAAGSTLNYSFAVKNYGTVPVKIVTAEYPFESLWVTVSPEDGDESVIDPDKTVKGNIRIEILPGTAPGDYHLDLDINCIQWNGDADELERWWNQPLQVEGIITVPAPETDGLVTENNVSETNFYGSEMDGSGTENDLTEQSITNEIQEVVE
ncbi:MAG: hypothetical protein GX119_07115 [Syntrophomonadaceae bacterium]|nr:hypothetical protein [Syntrophomonadaceae bacterium]